MGLAPLTAEQHRQADQDFEAAYTDALEARQHAANEKSVAYFASRLSAEDLHEAAGFYSSDIGRQIFSPDHVRTPEESQKMGLYVMSHPAILKLFKPSMSYLQTQLADAQASQAAFQQDVQARLCINLARDRISLPSCAAPGV